MPSSPDQQHARAQFFAALRSGDTGATAELLRRDPGLIHATDPACFGATPLVCAASAGDRAMIDLLIDAGADPDRATNWWAGGFRPLDDCDPVTADHLLSRGARLTPHAAARLGRLSELRALLDQDPGRVRERGGDGQLPLHFAANIEIASLLLDRGAELDARDLDHASTAAQWAASDRSPVAAYLVSRGAAPDLFMACMIGDTALAERLAAGEPGGVHATITAARFPAPGSQALGIYHYTVGTGCTAMHAAATSGAAQACGWLASRGLDVNATGGYDDATPLHQAAWQDRPDAARALVELGADINRPSGPLHRNTPLGWAIVAGSSGVVRVLLELGATVRDFHITDAASGARGAFRAFKRRVSLDQWRQVERLLAASRPAV